MSLPLQSLSNQVPANSVTIVVNTPEGPVVVEADVSATQAKRVLAMAKSLRDSANERPPLSPREKQVLGCLSRGLSYKQVAAELEISIDTVRTYVRALYRKLGAHSVTEAICRARELALV